MILHFLHGWGFDATFWSDLAGLLPEATILLSDRGYFGRPAIPELAEPHITVTHSFGTMLFLRDPSPASRGLVAINGFDCFATQADTPGVAPRVLDRMLIRFERDPQAVLNEFRRNCGAAPATCAFDTARLHKDLLALRDLDCRADSARWLLPLLSIQSANDPVLPPAMREAVFASAPHVDRLMHRSGGHLLPQTDAVYCAGHIRAFVDMLQ